MKSLIQTAKNSLSSITGTSVTPAQRKFNQCNDWIKDSRGIEDVSSILLSGSADVYFMQSDTPSMVIVAEKQEGIDSLVTRYERNKLVIEQKDNASSGNVSISSNRGSININCSGSNSSITINGKTISGGKDIGKVLVFISLPQLDAFKISGSGDVKLYELDSKSLDLAISGSGDFEAVGKVDILNATIQGSGDIEADELYTDHVTLTIQGSGDAELRAHSSASVTIMGSGDAKVYGNPKKVSEQVMGSGKVRFKK